MNYSDTLSYIHSLGNFSLPAGLERIKRVLNILGNPQDSFKSIHIAGTNGKGSVSCMLASVFKTAGFKTGLFISPYITDFCERIQINGEYIPQDDLCAFSEKVINTGERLTEFEFITAVAFLYFKEKKIDILICETGLGGRLDATNTLENKIATVITKIGLDHTAILGDTVEKITAEKCGILRDCVTVTSPNQTDAALNVIKKHTKKLVIPDLKALKVTESELNNEYIYCKKKYKLNLLGDYQIENSLTVIETVKNCGCDIPYSTVFEGLLNAFIPARNEIISSNPLVVLDGAHNPDGAKALEKELRRYNGNVTAIIGMMRDKDTDTFLKTLLPLCKNAVAVTVEGMERSLPAFELAVKASAFCECSVAADYNSAIKEALKSAENNPVFVFGSLYLASALRPILKTFFKN